MARPLLATNGGINSALLTHTTTRVSLIGALCIDFILTTSGPVALEYDVRLGDPELQALLTLLDHRVDLAAMLLACTNLTLHTHRLNLSPSPAYAIAVVVVAEGYPSTPKTGIIVDLRNLGEGKSSARFSTSDCIVDF